MAQNMVSDNFAPNWLPYLTPEDVIIPDTSFSVDCQICVKKLAIECEEDFSEEEFEEYRILPCGHTFGLECIELWLKASPSCRFPLWHTSCKHLVDQESLHLEADNTYTVISKCIVGGQGLNPCCDYCRGDYSYDDDDGIKFLEDLGEFFYRQD
ncbi:hypothetical protein F4678DRAFT_457946 [Xylaria arbuscula]|nr:hypothetical protein F4678DRAFT_457946 [Xylaria arbuscula]